ncbi:DUF2189 domain-containing protein [Rhodoferax sp. U2-2l]|uniref:DUF2189 domain-containing protein n=1 Tax=Rhodoferax sp. U2-2l TaxID=2884000 RepID=UPI001D09BB25|nr:DUF2189 domain-containing protein [Rhodoferax sp. U2-2l]MCB8746204.1 DUF2189 domain-containing protein [Rhodoferax sp. U2-2l]
MSTRPPEEPPAPYVPPPSEAPPKEIVPLAWSAPARWLRLGWRDLAAQPGISLFYGAAFWAMALALTAVFRTNPEYTMTLVSGCLLVGPFLALGLYDASRRREQGLPPDFVASLTCWRHHLRSLSLLVGVLIVLELLWGRASLVVIAVFFTTGMPSSVGIAQAVLNPQNLEFLMAYLMVGGVFATLVFATSVVSIPMILDRDTDAISAGITSIEVVLNNTGVMLWWAALIVVLTVVALLLPWSLGLLLVGPLLGHGSWHAYRGAVRWLPVS